MSLISAIHGEASAALPLPTSQLTIAPIATSFKAPFGNSATRLLAATESSPNQILVISAQAIR
jgi:hypothetical protein